MTTACMITEARKRLAAAIAGLTPELKQLQAAQADLDQRINALETLPTKHPLIHHDNLMLLKKKRVICGDQYCHLKDVSSHALDFWRFVLKEQIQAFHHDKTHQERITNNITLVAAALEELAHPQSTPLSQWQAISAIRYLPSRLERVTTLIQKTIRILGAAAVGFIACTMTGISLSGGFTALPAAIYANLQNIAALWGTAGASAATTLALGPGFFGWTMVRDELAKETETPLEKEMLKVKTVLIQQSKNTLHHQIASKLATLRARPEQHAIRAVHLLDAVMHRVTTLEQSATRWYCIDYASRRAKAQKLLIATQQMLDHLLPLDTAGWQSLDYPSLLKIKVRLEEQEQSFGSLLGTHRLPSLLTGNGIFAPTTPRALAEATAAWDSAPFSPAPRMC